MSTQAQFIANGKSLLQSAGTTLRYLGAQIEHAVSRKWGFFESRNHVVLASCSATMSGVGCGGVWDKGGVGWEVPKRVGGGFASPKQGI